MYADKPGHEIYTYDCNVFKLLYTMIAQHKTNWGTVDKASENSAAFQTWEQDSQLFATHQATHASRHTWRHQP